MILVNDYFDKVFFIGSDHRPDRAEQLAAELKRLQISAEFFRAHWKPVVDGRPNGNAGCTASHRSILGMISHYGWARTLILEDDAKFDPCFIERFSESITFVPDNWSMLYVGGHYGEMPKRRVNEHCIEINRMLSTHAYAVTADFARRVAPHIGGVGPIDSLYGQWHLTEPCYCLDPRLVAQRNGYSDLAEQVTNYEWVFNTRKHTWGELP